MKSFLCLLGLFSLPTLSDAAVFEVTAYDPIFSVEIEIARGQSVAALTRTLLDQAKESGKIEEYGFNGLGVETITPKGRAALGSAFERGMDQNLRAYGWCYSVDGIAPDLLADEYVLSGNENRIKWFYGYADRINGRWETQCTPVR